MEIIEASSSTSTDEKIGLDSFSAVYADETLKVYNSFLRPLGSEKTWKESYEEKKYYQDIQKCMFPADLNVGWKKKFIPKSFYNQRYAEESVVYILKCPQPPGKFNAIAAKNLNVAEGPEFARLIAGESVIAKDGSIVLPSQCVFEAKPASLIIVLDLPSPSFIQSLLNNLKLKELLKNDRRVTSVVHILGLIIFFNF